MEDKRWNPGRRLNLKEVSRVHFVEALVLIRNLSGVPITRKQEGSDQILSLYPRSDALMRRISDPMHVNNEVRNATQRLTDVCVLYCQPSPLIDPLQTVAALSFLNYHLTSYHTKAPGQFSRQ